MVCDHDIYTTLTYEVTMEAEGRRTEYLKTVCSDCFEKLKVDYSPDDSIPVTDFLLAATTDGTLRWTNSVSDFIKDIESHQPPMGHATFRLEIYGIQEGQPRYIHTILYPINNMKAGAGAGNVCHLGHRYVDQYGVHSCWSYTYVPCEYHTLIDKDQPITELEGVFSYIGSSPENPKCETHLLATGRCDWSQGGPYRKLEYRIDAPDKLEIIPSEPCDYTLPAMARPKQ